MTDVIAFSNQKGGVGKTTSSISVAAELALSGYSVLLVDFDPQGSATSGVGVVLETNSPNLCDLFFGRLDLNGIICDTKIPNLKVAPAVKELVHLESELGKKSGRELILKSALELHTKSYDFIIIDCPPSSGLLTQNALGAANYIAIPLQAEYYALEGLSALMGTISFVQQTFNPSLQILGVFMTMFDGRTNLALQVEQEAREFFKDLMFPVRVPRNIKLSECPSHGLPICLYDPQSGGAKAYKILAQEIARRVKGKGEEQPQLVGNG